MTSVGTPLSEEQWVAINHLKEEYGRCQWGDGVTFGTLEESLLAAKEVIDAFPGVYSGYNNSIESKKPAVTDGRDSVGWEFSWLEEIVRKDFMDAIRKAFDVYIKHEVSIETLEKAIEYQKDRQEIWEKQEKNEC